MPDSVKVAIIKAMIGDFWDFLNEDQQEMGAMALVTAIYSVVNMGDDS